VGKARRTNVDAIDPAADGIKNGRGRMGRLAEVIRGWGEDRHSGGRRKRRGGLC